MYNIWFDCSALAISAIILLSYFTRNSIPILQNKIFLSQVIVAVISTALNLLLGIMQNQAHPGRDPGLILIMEIIAFFYHILRMLNAFLYIYYILIVLNLTERTRFQFVWAVLPALLSIIVCLAGSFDDLVYSVDSTGIHHTGPLMPALYAVAIYYMLLISGLTIYYRRTIPLARRIAFHSFSTLVMGTVLVERLFPTIMIEGLGSVLCQLLIYLTIQRPEEVVDGETGLLNKISFLRMLSIKFRRSASFDLILIVIDNFHFLEESLGLRVWGLLMMKVANYLRRLSTKARIFRISEGTLCVMAPRSTSGSELLLEKLKMRSANTWNVAGLSINLQARLTLFHFPEDAGSVEEVMNLLHIALPDAQTQDGLKLETSAAARIKEVERALKEALEKKSFEVVYQPIYSASHGRFYSAEALLRLTDEKLGPVAPDEFIPIAEKSGYIVRIGQFVLEEVCRFIAENGLARMGIAYIEVNLSIVECLQDDLVDSILMTLIKYDIDTRLINLEITETASETYPDMVIRNIKRLSENGIRFSLDDYGTGYSNIGRILTMPLDIIKLDKTIIHTYFLSNTLQADVVLEETLRMLRRLNKWVVAEGVETKEQADRLIQLGCEFLQGYYYARPMSAQALLDTLSEYGQKEEPARKERKEPETFLSLQSI